MLDELASGVFAPTYAEALSAARALAEDLADPVVMAEQLATEATALVCAGPVIAWQTRYLIGSAIESRLFEEGWDANDIPSGPDLLSGSTFGPAAHPLDVVKRFGRTTS
jgi:hypothetical protein